MRTSVIQDENPRMRVEVDSIKKQTVGETDEIQQNTNCVSRRRGDGLDASACI
jgi:hypothetical protein